MNRPNIEKLIIYRDIIEEKIIKNANKIWRFNKHEDGDNIEKLYYQLQSQLLNQENLNSSWKSFIMETILKNENTFSLLSEINDNKEFIRNIAKKDISIIKTLYNYNWDRLSSEMGDRDTSILCRNHVVYDPYEIKIKAVLEKEDDVDDDDILEFEKYYSEKGCGLFREYSAFKWDNKRGLIGIKNVDSIRCSDLTGYQIEKETILNNTENFVKGYRVNNILLYGDKGTGKSSTVKAVLNEFKDKKLKMIEMTKEQFSVFPTIIEAIGKRGYRFIIFIDDLSFEEFEVEYKYFKAILEGGIEVRPENVVLYATSNRRHIVKESWKDQQENSDDLHLNDSVQEKISLADRFGITITFQSPNKDLYLSIVEDLAQKENIKIDKEKLFAEALKWEMRYHGRSGRTARQFIDYLISREEVGHES